MEADVSTDWNQEQHIQLLREQRDALLDALSRVMSTLSRSAGSPEEAAVWREAWAVLAEYGRRP